MCAIHDAILSKDPMAARRAVDVHIDDAWHRHVIIEFDIKAQALACYHSPEYQEARSHRAGACTANIVIIEGLPPAWSCVEATLSSPCTGIT